MELTPVSARVAAPAARRRASASGWLVGVGATSQPDADQREDRRGQLAVGWHAADLVDLAGDAQRAGLVDQPAAQPVRQHVLTDHHRSRRCCGDRDGEDVDGQSGG